MSVLRRVDAALVAPGSEHALGCVRVGLAVVVALRAATGPYRALAGQPEALFVQPWWMPFDAMPIEPVLVALQVGTVAAAALCVSGKAPRAGFAGAWLGLLVLAGLRGSLGKVLHNDVLLLLCAVPVLFAPRSARPGRPLLSPAAGWPRRGALAVCGAVYFVTGLQKLRHSGLDWVFSDNLSWVLHSGAASGRAPTPAIAHAIADRAWLATLTAAGILAFELSAPILLAVRRWRVWFLAGAVVLHVGTWLTLGLDYWGWILTVAVLTIPWDEVVPSARALVPCDTTGTSGRGLGVPAARVGGRFSASAPGDGRRRRRPAAVPS